MMKNNNNNNNNNNDLFQTFFRTNLIQNANHNEVIYILQEEEEEEMFKLYIYMYDNCIASPCKTCIASHVPLYLIMYMYQYSNNCQLSY